MLVHIWNAILNLVFNGNKILAKRLFLLKMCSVLACARLFYADWF